MLYRPNFCCECGVKIERSEWKIWTDRRFCENCEIEKREYVLFPKIFAFFLGIFALVGVSGFFQKSEKPLNVTNRQFASTDLPKTDSVPVKNGVQPPIQNVSGQNLPLKRQTEPKIAENVRLEANTVSGKPISNSVEPVYYCGAKTKKGTACTRRVKGGGRCWQHTGQTAMFEDEKLLVNR